MGRARRIAAAIGLIVPVPLPVGHTPQAGAEAIFIVTNTFDDGPGSLRQAVLDADANPGRDLVWISLPSTYVINLTTGLTSNDSLVVEGNGVTLTLEGSSSRIWSHSGGSHLEVRNLNLTGTHAGVSGITSDGDVTVTGVRLTGLQSQAGGAIVASGVVTMTDSIVSNSSAQTGGAIAADTVTVTTTSFIGNRSTNGDFDTGGGAIWVANGATVSDSVFIGNSSAAAGGAIRSEQGPIDIERSAFTANTAVGDGGAVFGLSATITVTQSSFAENSASNRVRSGGAALAMLGAGTVRLANSTFADNTVAENTDGHGAAVAVPTSSVDLSFVTFDANTSPTATDVLTDQLTSFGTVFSGSSGNHCLVTGSSTSNGYNVEESTSSCGLDDPTDQQASGSPNLGGLEADGGPTQWATPQVGSLLIDRIPSGVSTCAGTDQRGTMRPRGAGCDIGAIETLGSFPAPDIDPPSRAPDATDPRVAAAPVRVTVPVVAIPVLAG